MSDRRAQFRKGLSPLYLPYYDALCAELGPEWEPYYGIRTIAEQDALWAKGRTQPGPVVTSARGAESPHVWGCATDWTVWDRGQPQWLKYTDTKWDQYEVAVDKVGLMAGGLFHDHPHNELHLKRGWRLVNQVFLAQGKEAAERYIETLMVK